MGIAIKRYKLMAINIITATTRFKADPRCKREIEKVNSAMNRYKIEKWGTRKITWFILKLLKIGNVINKNNQEAANEFLSVKPKLFPNIKIDVKVIISNPI